MLKATCHTPEGGWENVDDYSTISELVCRKGHVVLAYGEISNLQPGEIDQMATEFGLHPLAVEDAISGGQRPKLDVYADHILVCLHELSASSEKLQPHQMCFFIGPRWVIVLHDGANRTMDELLRRLVKLPSERGVEAVVHTFLDTLVDDYEAIADQLEDDVIRLEDLLLEDIKTPVDQKLYLAKQRLSALRRYALPASRILDRVVARDTQLPFANEDTLASFRDVDDHMLRLADQVRAIDDLTDAVLELRRSSQSQALNEIIKRLTGWAAIVAIPTLIASIYGMNYELIPSTGGFRFALGAMGASVLGLFIVFRRRGWL